MQLYNSCSDLHQNFFSTSSEMESRDIFGSLADFQSIPALQYENQLLHDPHNEESSARNSKKDTETHDCNYERSAIHDENEELSMEARRRKRDKKPRSGTLRNLYEKRRRDRIREKMKVLQGLIPIHQRHGEASILDDAINYVKALKSKVEMLSSTWRQETLLTPAPRMGMLSVCDQYDAVPMLQFQPSLPVAGLHQMSPSLAYQYCFRP
ncbi:transcription factor PHYTOCHROME INTERACTING FACTOR-LIKE 13-like [Mercurialis annua]|uniref:transcription factor PHYTOCHROME INTERACTING FACTOR-LIKE 13-like n=1 Tax=Mercurialis annua TaxID=3986 RepID=UPI00215E71B9|nr:transcription factor PHYTOCHROME INTERACTING FACTOR-LIKE 13-like [Mercurialis annua]